MHADDRILVTGATGNTGSILLQQLARRGAVVRAMVRSSKDDTPLPSTSAHHEQRTALRRELTT